MAAPRKRPVPRIVAVGGGKGGVGKSTVAANLALAIGRLGHRVALVDADLGAANLHTMLGALHPASTLSDFLDQTVDSLDAVRLNVGPNVDLIPGSSRPGSANLPASQKVRLIRAIARTPAFAAPRRPRSPGISARPRDAGCESSPPSAVRPT